jgi:hypothetical protein
MPPGGPAFPTLGVYPQNAPPHLQVPVPGPGSPYTTPQQYANPYFAQQPHQPPSNLHPHPPPIFPPQMVDPRRPSANIPQSPLRQSHSHMSSYSQGRQDYYSSASTTSDSDNAARSRSSKHRSRSRRPSGGHSSSSSKRKGALGTIATVGGLAALLDGIVELGVL